MTSQTSRITVNPDICGGRPTIRGKRIRVSDVLDLLAAETAAKPFSRIIPILRTRTSRRRWNVALAVDFEISFHALLKQLTLAAVRSTFVPTT